MTYRVTTAVHAEVGGHGDSAAEPKEGVENVESDHQHWVSLETLLERRRYEVEQRQHRKDGQEHVVSDYRWVASEC